MVKSGYWLKVSYNKVVLETRHPHMITVNKVYHTVIGVLVIFKLSWLYKVATVWTSFWDQGTPTYQI